jgi:hypothetical protein
VTVIGEPGIRSVPVGEQRRSGLHVGPHKSLDRSRGVSGIAARRMRPDRVSRYFAPIPDLSDRGDEQCFLQQHGD